MNVTVTKTSTNRTRISISYSKDSSAGWLATRRFRVYAPGGVFDSDTFSAVSNKTWEFDIEDYPDYFIRPYPNQSTGSFNVSLEKNLIVEVEGGWSEIEKISGNSYNIYSNEVTRPSITMTLSPINAYEGYYMKGESAVKATFSGSGQYGADIKSYSLSVEGKNYSSPYQSNTFTTSGAISIVGTVTDTRGLTTTTTEVVQVLNNRPLLNSVACSTAYVDGLISCVFTPPSNTMYSRLILQSNASKISQIDIGTATGETTKTYPISAEELIKIYEKFPQTSSAVLSFTLETFTDSGYSNKFGSSTKEITLSIPQNDTTKPIIDSISIVPSIVLLNNNTLFVRNKNGATSTISSHGQHGATISSEVWTLEGKEYANGASSSNFTTSGAAIKILAKVTDTRGFEQTKSHEIKVEQYESPRCSITQAKRVDPEGRDNDEGEILYIVASRIFSDVTGNNKCLLRCRVKAEGETSWQSYQTLLDYDDAGNTYDGSTGISIEKEKSYQIELSVADLLNGAGQITSAISSTKIFMDKDGSLNSLALGGYCKLSNSFECFWDGVFYASLVLKDQTNTDMYRIIIDNGQLKTEKI